jgi:polar amino acid transport system substrate-binding protein
MAARVSLWLFLLIVSFSGAPRAETSLPSQILVCEDELETPPLTYRSRERNPNSAESITGYSAAIIREIAATVGASVKITLMPWLRCQLEIAAGRQHLALNVTWNAERADKYLFSRAHFTAHDHYYFSLGRFPNGLVITSLKDLKDYSFCGLNGFNYAQLGVVADKIDYEARDHRQIMLKLSFGHCDLFVEKQEIMSGFALIGKDWLHYYDIGHHPLPETAETRFHMLIQPGATGAVLKRLIDGALEKMEADGRLEILRQRFIDTKS